MGPQKRRESPLSCGKKAGETPGRMDSRIVGGFFVKPQDFEEKKLAFAWGLCYYN